MKKKAIKTLLFAFSFVMLMGWFTAASATGLNTELVTNGGGETGSISGWTDDTGASRWNSDIAYSDWALPSEGSYYFYLYCSGMENLSGTMSQEIPLTDEDDLFSSISAGNVSINFSISMFQAISADNEVKAVLEEYDAGGTLLKTSQVVNTTTSGAMGSYQINTQIQPNTRKFKVILSATLTNGGYAQFDQVSLKLVNAPTGSAPVFGSDFPTSAETDAGVTYGPVPFTISDADAGDVDTLTFSASSTNVNLAPSANITVGGSGGNRTLTIVPAGNLSGEADITIVASDGTKSAEKTFHFIVHKVITMGTNLVENGNGTSDMASWSGNTVNITATGDGFSTNDPDGSMSQNIDISKFSSLIDGGETNFLMSAAFPNTYGQVSAQFYTDIACTNAVGTSFHVNGSAASLQQKIPANTKGVKITFSNTYYSYSTILVRNISFQIINDFPKLSAISDQTTNLSALTVPVSAYYTTASATLTAASSDQAVVSNSGFTYGGSGFNRTVTFTPLKNGTATITVTLNDGTTSASKSFSVTALEPASVSSVDTPAAGYYASGGQLDFTVHFNHAITGGTGSTLPLTIGSATVAASYLSSTADSITYRYPVAGGDAGVVTIGTAIDDASSPITDTDGFDAEMGISAGATGVTVVRAPQVTSTAAGDSATYGDTITFTAALSCADSLSGTIQFQANGTNLGTPVTVSGNAASYETAEKPFHAGTVSITAQFVPSGAGVHFSSLTSGAYAVTIQRKALSVESFTAAAKIYNGATDVSLSGGTLVGVLTGDDVSAVYPATGTAAEKNAGTRSVTYAAITLDGADKDNYVIPVPPTVNVDISKKAVTATVTVSSKTYDGNTNADVTCSFNPGVLITGDVVAVTASGTFNTKDVGTEKTVSISVPSITITGTDKDNYDISVDTGKGDIHPAAITVTPDAATKVYGQDDPALTYTITSGALVGTETLSGSLSRAAGEDVNQYEITQGTVTSENNTNYTISFTGGVKLTITQATPLITVSADKATQMTGKDVVVTATVTYPNKKETDAYPTVSFTPVNATAAGSITVNGNQYSQTFTMGTDLATPASFSASADENGNYTGASSTAPATVAIIDRYTPTVSITSNKGSSVTYGDTVTFTATVSGSSDTTPKGTVQFSVDGVDFDSVRTLDTAGAAGIEITAEPLTAGSRTITAHYSPAPAETDYKANTSAPYSLTVGQRTVSVTGLSASTKVYDGTTVIELTGGTIENALPGAALSANIPTQGTVLTKTVADGKPVSFVPIVLNGADKDNYVLSAQPTVNVDISKKAVTATVTVSSKTYDGNTNADVTCSFNPGVLITGDVVAVTASGTFNTKDVGTEKTVSISVPSITITGTDKDNYDISVDTGKGDILPAAITVTPDAATKVYGQDDPALTYTITSGALVGTETLAGSLSRAAGEDVSQYEITQGTVTSENNTNYLISFTGGTKLTITQAAPKVTVTPSKETPVYGDSVTFTATVEKSGSGAVPAGSVQFLLGSDSLGSTVTLVGGNASYTTTTLPSGTKNITAEYSPSAGETNYSSNTSAACSITITQKEVTVKAEDKTIYVGGAIPALTYTVSGLIGSDTLVTLPTLSLPADASSSKAANYTISVTGAAVSGNYSLKLVSGTLQVINAPDDSDYVPPSNTVTAPATAQTGGNANAAVTSGQISQAVTAALREAAQEEGAAARVEIQVQGADHADAVAVTVPKEAFASLTDHGLDELRLSTPVGTLSFDADALSAISQNASADINLKMEALDTAALSEDVQQTVGNRPVYDFTITSGEETISSFGGGTVTVSVPYTLQEGEDPNQIIIYYIADNGELTPVSDCVYDVETGTVLFAVEHFSTYAVGYQEVNFEDVSGWYADYVNYLAARGLMQGASADTFAPDRNITRAEFVMILANLSKDDLTGYTVSAFGDVDTTAWYFKAVQWAYETGIVTGSSGAFYPDGEITRQDMAVMLLRFAEKTGYVLPKTADAVNFPDRSAIASYAAKAVTAMQQAGILSGCSDGTFSPQDSATRAQAAKMIALYLQRMLTE